MAGQLRRGVMHYDEGGIVPDQAPAAGGFRTWLGDIIGMRGREQQVRTQGFAPAPAPAPPNPYDMQAPAGGFGQVLQGHLTEASQSPQSSPATQAIAGAADYVNKAARAQNLTAGPLTHEWIYNTFFGDPGTTAVLNERANAAKTLSHPVVQQNLINDREHLHAAEANPVAYAQKIMQDPEFAKNIQAAVNAHDQASKHPNVPPEDTSATAKVMTDHNLDAGTAHAAVAPHKYTREEFANATKNLTTDQFIGLFGHLFKNQPTPQQQAFDAYVNELKKPMSYLMQQYATETDEKKRAQIRTDYQKEQKLYQQELGKLVKGVPMYQQ